MDHFGRDKINVNKLVVVFGFFTQQTSKNFFFPLSKLDAFSKNFGHISYETQMRKK